MNVLRLEMSTLTGDGWAGMDAAESPETGRQVARIAHAMKSREYHG